MLKLTGQEFYDRFIDDLKKYQFDIFDEEEQKLANENQREMIIMRRAMLSVKRAAGITDVEAN